MIAFFAIFLLLPAGNGGMMVSANSAQDQQLKANVEKQKMLDRNVTLEVLSKTCYIILWPLIAFAGLAMDNTMVYGSFMYLDVSLWKIWMIVRNLANFFL